MDQEQVNKIMYQMTDVLDNTQMMHLKKVLEDLSSEEITEDDSEELLERFIATKRLEGRSERTLKYYRITIEKMMKSLGKNVRAITTDDLRHYLADYQRNSNASKMSIDNIRRNL